MHESLRVATWALICTTMGIFCVVPALIWALGLQGIIFYRGDITFEILALNASLVIPLVAGLFLLRRRSWRALLPVSRKTCLIGLQIFIGVWILIFLLYGGLDYRQSDVNVGYGARSMPLQIALALGNLVTISATALLVESRSTGRRGLGVMSSVLAYAFVLVLSGSRGLVVQLLLTVWIALHLQLMTCREHAPIRNCLCSTMSGVIPRGFKQTVSPRLFSVKVALLGLLTIALLGVWGTFRDEQQDALFATIYRAAEPYWHHALVRQREQGSDLTVLMDSVGRIASIPGRWFGVQYDSTIDGAEHILEYKLGIVPVEGVSLPITYIGEGFLLDGYSGAMLFQVLTYLMVVASFFLLARVRGLRPSLQVALVAFQVVKCIFLYPKSLSGVFLVMFYETLRDYIMLFFLSQILNLRRVHANPK